MSTHSTREPAVVYIAHPISYDVHRNIERIEAILSHLMQSPEAAAGRIWPVAPYLHAFDHLDNNNPAHYDLGMRSNKIYFERRFVDQLWVCGDPFLSEGVRQEIEWAALYGIRIMFEDFSDTAGIPPAPPVGPKIKLTKDV